MLRSQPTTTEKMITWVHGNPPDWQSAKTAVRDVSTFSSIQILLKVQNMK
jgi:hypothetical protein